jgi:hypothetical protein
MKCLGWNELKKWIDMSKFLREQPTASSCPSNQMLYVKIKEKEIHS